MSVAHSVFKTYNYIIPESILLCMYVVTVCIGLRFITTALQLLRHQYLCIFIAGGLVPNIQCLTI